MSKEQQFLHLLQQHRNILYKVSRMYMDTAQDQEDLVQEITFQLWKSYCAFEGKSEFSTWMYRVALNTALTYFKKEKRKVDQISLTGAIDKSEDDHHSAVAEERLDYFYKAVQDLTKVEKALIFLFLEGHSHREIALNLGISEGNARVKLNRTKEKLQNIIKKNGYEF
ncbi:MULTISPECIES: RNA polymerase sigma factor [Sphingobacterium]|uniref:RNA polymerase sigma factor n=1 Tax=Sphingobacterium populi TaxID=1812824 RepID=A0ABW5UCN1_9SPHI|nr:RNA polymerase sigma factor [Sphingobacterium sp. CFCC 11742]